LAPWSRNAGESPGEEIRIPHSAIRNRKTAGPRHWNDAMKHEAVLFDLDGTLLNTIEDLTDSMNAALAVLGCPPRSVEECKLFVGDGVRLYAERALPQGRRDEPIVARCVALMREQYARRWHVKTRPYDGIDDLLAELARRGVTMAVLSNKPDDFTRLTVEHYFERRGRRFAAVRGVGPDGVAKPDPAGALAVADALGTAPSAFLYLGDTATDMRTAVAAGMFPAGAAWGFRGVEELLSAGARALVHHPMELPGLL